MKSMSSRLPRELKERALQLHGKGTIVEIAKRLGIPKSTLWDFYETAEAKERLNADRDGPKILFLDVETSMSLVYTFDRFKAFVKPEAVMTEPYLLTYAYAYGDEDEIHSHKLTDFDLFDFDITNDFSLVSKLRDLLDKADIVVAHNARFDVGWFNQRCCYWFIAPPSPYKVICTYSELKRHFSLPSNSLDSSTRYFNLDKKLSHEGISLWVGCMQGKRECFEAMENYNRGDINTLKQLYLTIRPFIKAHPNVSLYYKDTIPRCTKCGSSSLIETDSYYYTASSRFKVLSCQDCGSNNRSKSNELKKEKTKSMLNGA